MKKKRPPQKKRSDAERRVRQSERLSRSLRVLNCILGPGRWDAAALARELEISHRTVHRIMETLTLSGIPWYYCKKDECYRVRPGFKFPGFGGGQGKDLQPQISIAILESARTVLTEGQRFLESVDRLIQSLESK